MHMILEVEILFVQRISIFFVLVPCEVDLCPFVRLHEADRAISHLNTGQIDGNVIRVEALEGLC